MKNSFLIALFALVTAGIFSCTKEKTVGSSTNTSNSRTITTDLFSMTFESRTDDNGTTFWQGDHNLGVNDADINDHRVFVYATNNMAGQSHQLLPFSVASDDASYSFTSTLNEGSISVRIDSDSQDQGIDQFADMQFQVILVSAEDYSRLQQINIDWSDYFAVINALRSLPLPSVRLESDSQASSNN
jgi:hypothetical protein